MRSPEPIRPLALRCLTAAGAALVWGGCITEPMPDIPETVEYETIKLEYGDDDLLVETGESQEEPAPAMGALVGEPSEVASLARGAVRDTNRTIRDVLRLVETIRAFPPSDYDAGVWTWEHHRDDRPDGPDYMRFQIERLDDAGPGEEAITYRLIVGPEKESAAQVLDGSFTNLGRRNGRQRGFGIIRYDFDALRSISPSFDGPQGRIAIAFRAAGSVRQVRVGLFDFRGPADGVVSSAIYRYVQLPGGQGRFAFFTGADILGDGAPLELLGVDAVWNRRGAGRAEARVSEGSLEVDEVLLEECWDEGATVIFAESEPTIGGYDGGARDACAAGVLAIDLQAPVYAPPSEEPEVPGPHAEEQP